MGKKSKHKEKKKKRHAKRKKSPDRTEETGLDTVEAAEAPVVSTMKAEVSPPVEREEWMTKPKEGWLSDSSRRHGKRSEDDTKETKQDPPVHKPGLYVPEGSRTQQGVSRSFVGDGGASWRRKALKRMQERSQMEDKSLEQIAEERGVNLDRLKQDAMRSSSRRERVTSHRFSNRSYLDDIHSHKREMKKPQSAEKSIFARRREKTSEEGDKGQSMQSSTEALSGLNKFPSDGSFLQMFAQSSSSKREGQVDWKKREEAQKEATPLGNASVAQQLREQLGSHISAEDCRGRSSHRTKTAEQTRPAIDRGNVAGVSGQEEISKKRRDLEEFGDIMTLYKRSRYGDEAIDVDRALAKNISRHRRFNDKEDMNADMEYDFGVGTDLFGKKSKKNRRETLSDVQRREKRRIAKIEGRHQTIQDRCSYCFDSPLMPKHLVVSIATTAYLRLPQEGALDPLHCCIVPLEHVPSTREVDEDVWTEIRNFKKALIQMSQSKGRSVIFLETAIHLQDRSRHAFVECIPVESRVIERAPMYYKKAIDDATADWSQHHSKRCIETGSKGLRGSIPAHFPYFHVEFNLSRGFVHVIDDEAQFDAYLGRRVLIGLLNRPAEEMYQRMDQRSMTQQRACVQAFTKQWHAYDWTLQL